MGVDATSRIIPDEDDPIRARTVVEPDELTTITYPYTEVELEVVTGWRQDSSGESAVYIKASDDNPDDQGFDSTVELPLEVATELSSVLDEHVDEL